MKQGDPIPYSACHNCDPETWCALRPSKYLWKCKGCNKVTSMVLELTTLGRRRYEMVQSKKANKEVDNKRRGEDTYLRPAGTQHRNCMSK